MNGKKNYIGVAVALAGAATIGIAPRPAAADPSRSADELGAPVVLETTAQDEWPQAGPTTTIDIVEASLGRPHLIDDAFADVLVRLRGGVCSGTPITGTVYVVTAAHCVLTDSGEVTRKTVVRDHVRYPAVAVLVDTDYAQHPSAALDAAVLIMAQVIPGPSARIGTALPESGDVTLAGYQPLDRDGGLWRGHGPHDLPKPTNADGGPVVQPYAPAGCVAAASALDVSAARVMVPCGLVPGASGGGLYTEQDGEVVLVGILSTVTADLAANGIVPLAALQELLQHPEQYAHGFSTAQAHHEHDRVERS
jgi:hypothetical protein